MLFPVFEGRGKGKSPDLIFCGDDEGAKKTAASLIRDVGFNPVDMGGLSAARDVEPFSLLVAQLAYNNSDGPALAYHFEHFSRPRQITLSFSASARERTVVPNVGAGPIDLREQVKLTEKRPNRRGEHAPHC